MKCIICGQTINVKKHHAYVTVKADNGRERKVHACGGCQEAFDRWIDSRATDSDGNLLETPTDPAVPA